MFFNKNSRSHHQENITMLSPPRNWIHHVFPSFHGADVRTNFLSHIVKEFRSKGIDLFIDKNIERSKSIGPALIEAIRGSRIAIVMLSRNYASSTWCLNELVEIIKCRQELDQTVIPIFYKVNPTHVKKQTGDVGKVFQKTCKGKRKEEIQRWKHALTEVAQIEGYHSTNWGTDAEMIEDIVIDVSNKLNLSAPCSDFNTLVGIESHMTRMGPLLQLDSDEVRKIGILGPSGIGKTTIARSLFNRHSQDFQLSVFIDNIKRNYSAAACSDDYSVKLNLQKQFMSQLTNEACIKVPHLGIAKDRLKDKKVLVVLDDVDHSIQVEAMAKETSWFGPGSRIIVTTQDQKVLRASGINHIHIVDLPSDYEALQMFCMYAFGKKKCKYGFDDLAWEVVSIVGRLPLGIRVMGSYFRGMSKQDWTDELPKLRTHLDRDGEIASILKFSYDALRDEEKSLFLHVSCFFNGESVDIVEGCLAKCFLDVKQGIRILAEKSLISIKMGMIDMAELLVQLGRKIVREQSVSEPGKRQFLNEAVDIDEVLCDDKSDSRSVIGIDLNDDIACTERAFERLSNLQFLRIIGYGVSLQSMNYISQKLRVLVWPWSEMTCFPSSFNPNFLVRLEMNSSKLEKLWEEIKPLNNLKWMDLSKSANLEELPDLSTATNLQELNLKYCTSLVELPFSIGNATSLRKLNMSRCSKVVGLPFSIGNAVSLQEMNLSYCSSLVRLPSSIGNATNLQKLNLSHCSSLVRLPFSIGNAVNLKKLNMSYCSSLVELPSSIGNMVNLQKLDLGYCSSLVELPFSIGNAINLQKLLLRRCSSLVELPSSMRNLSSLSELELKKCSKLEVVLADINLESLKKLNLLGCLLMKSYHDSSTDIQELDPWTGRKSCLQFLELRGMKKLVSLPPFPDSVYVLDARNYISLRFINCFKLNQEARDLIIYTPTRSYAVFPAGEVPRCFTYRSSGSSLTMKLNQTRLDTSTKFKACILCAGEYNEELSIFVRVCCRITSGGNDLTYCKKEVGELVMGHLYTFEVKFQTVELTSNELVLSSTSTFRLFTKKI
ncbi:hypothetical protein N665_0671s0016 [Sinapis alba]|nr:hypothetical protein N665_0671s0016 [Sinapis alba]